ncbi:chloride channel protein [Niabella sp. CC-SYL272]|uniref:chloride channel protein n=1 Tax=Niabella agricola TaxID=2891571 RepID=UPI001F2CE2BA|nr:chloride channel protein [Niabella agricola]MCF3108783.1 chloride channel protein [Niabella agricola]
MSRTQFLILSGILVGITSGLAGVALKSLVHHIHYFITHKIHFEYQILFYIIFPFLGIVLTTAIVISFFKGQSRKGIGAILYEIAQNSSIVSPVKMYSQVFQSAITVGLGGSAGLESPIAVTGAAIGSNFAQTYKLNYKERTLLLAAGATAGIASAFNAPIAGIMFAFEILLTGVVFTDFIPLVVAAICGSLVSKIILQEDALFRFHAREPFNYLNTLYYLALGLLTAFYARYFLLISQKVEHWFQRIKGSKMQRAMVGGILLSILCVLLPPLFGEGYDAIKAFSNGQVSAILHNSFLRYFDVNEWTVILFLALICILKAFATPFTIFGGGNGGNFAPSLFAGGTLGYLFALLCKLAGFEQVPETNLVLAGMAGVMSGVLYAPLTAIFLIAESSFGYDLFIPLMIVSVISYLIAKRFSPISPDLKPLADEGKIFTRAHDKNLLSLLHIADLIDKQAQRLSPGDSLSTLLELIKTGNKNIFAVVDTAGQLCGVLTLDDIRQVLFAPDPGSIKIASLMKPPPTVIHINDDMFQAVKAFDETGAWQLPVISNDETFIGFISKSNILLHYRKLMQAYSE